MKYYICHARHEYLEPEERAKGNQFTLTQLEKREEDDSHCDYCCPACGKVLICETHRIKGE